MKAIQSPPVKLPPAICQTPAKMNRNAKKRPVLAAMTVERRMSPVIDHTMARKTRPPSSGLAGDEVEERQGEVDIGEIFRQAEERFDAVAGPLVSLLLGIFFYLIQPLVSGDKKLRGCARRMVPCSAKIEINIST
jgi:hypothetical protein